MQTLIALARFLFVLMFAMSAAGLAGAAEICQPSSPGYFHKYWSGKIDGKYAVKMELTCRDGTLQGNYFYVNKGVRINLTGRVGPAGTMALEENAWGNMPSTGSFAGTLGANHVDGMWTAADGKRSLPFAAGQTSEIHLGTRREIVGASVGDYALASIAGNGGANAMWDTGKTGKGWESSVSSNSGGMRQGSQIKLTRADQRLLDSLIIRVRPDLTTELFASGRVILTIPYSDRGAQFNISSAENASVRQSLEKQWTQARLEDETVYLLAQDGIDFSRHISGNFDGVVGDILLVTYAIVGNSFDVKFMAGQCCSESVFTFKRQQRPQQNK
ncbi:hypothetical protein [Massilia sp. S19_KUP03_FR1]|uniref:hypothetical protein n=1 Tax=Massilia sp. S19_KUP03_FR1 TaxID=3025503 RepID=UPI002FCCD0D8